MVCGCFCALLLESTGCFPATDLNIVDIFLHLSFINGNDSKLVEVFALMADLAVNFQIVAKLFGVVKFHVVEF